MNFWPEMGTHNMLIGKDKKVEAFVAPALKVIPWTL